MTFMPSVTISPLSLSAEWAHTALARYHLIQLELSALYGETTMSTTPTLSSTAHPRRPIVLSIAGSDSGGGAGIQADIKTISALGGFAATAITAVTAQNTRGVQAVHVIPNEILSAQIHSVVTDLHIDAIKIGMLGSATVATTVATALHESGLVGRIPIVWDPVMVASSGDSLFADDDGNTMVTMSQLASLITPNGAEAVKLGQGIDRATLTRVNVLITGGADNAAVAADDCWWLAGHSQKVQVSTGEDVSVSTGADVRDSDTIIDTLRGPDFVRHYCAARIETNNTHGTGCSLSSALAVLAATKTIEHPEAARINDPACWDDIVIEARDYLRGALAAGRRLSITQSRPECDKPSHGPVDHFYAHER